MKKWMVLGLCFVTFFSVGCTKQEETFSLVEDGSFLFVYDTMPFPLGDVFLKSAYGDALKITTEKSKNHTQKIRYTYKHYEVVTYIEEDLELINQVILLDNQTSTMEGVKVSDKVEKMLQIYGENYQIRNDGYEYFKGETSLMFYVSDSSITKIEYRYKAKTNFDTIEDNNPHTNF